MGSDRDEPRWTPRRAGALEGDIGATDGRESNGVRPPSSNPPPEVPVAFKCRCGNRIVLEPRWIGKPTACAGCEAHFVPTFVFDADADRWVPYLRYTPVFSMADKIRKSKGAIAPANIVCECGTKIGFEQRLHGRNMICSTCGREFAVRLIQRRDAAPIAAIVQGASPAKAAGAKPLPPPPPKMHAVCPCGEEMNVPSILYDRTQMCPECGAPLRFQLTYDEPRGQYRLQATPE